MVGGLIIPDEALHKARLSFSNAVIEIIKRLEESIKNNESDKINSCLNVIQMMLSGQRVDRELDVEDEEVRKHIDTYLNFIEKSEDRKDGYLKFADALTKICTFYHDNEKSKFFYDMLGTSFGKMIENTLSPQVEWQQKLLGVLTQNKITYEQYSKLSLEKKEVMFPNGHVNFSHFFELDKDLVDNIVGHVEVQEIPYVPQVPPVSMIMNSISSASSSSVSYVSSATRSVYGTAAWATQAVVNGFNELYKEVAETFAAKEVKKEEEKKEEVVSQSK